MIQPYVRIISYTITDPDSGLRIEQYLRRRLYSRSDLALLKRSQGAVCLNHHPVRLLTPVNTGDLLTVSITESCSSPGITPCHLPLSILYEDEDLIVIDKPAGMPTHPSRKNQDNSLASALAWYYRKKELPFIFRCANRLDQDTSGVIPVARHSVAGSILASLGAAKQISRQYLAITAGILTPACGTISAPLGWEDPRILASQHQIEFSKDTKNGPLLTRTIDWEHGEPAVTHYRLLETGDHCSLTEIRLETGRTHQIRAHMKFLGYPLLGDYLYHPDMEQIQRQALHSHRMTFPHPMTGEQMTFTAPLPQDMRAGFGWTYAEDSF